MSGAGQGTIIHLTTEDGLVYNEASSHTLVLDEAPVGTTLIDRIELNPQCDVFVSKFNIQTPIEFEISAFEVPAQTRMGSINCITGQATRFDENDEPFVLSSTQAICMTLTRSSRFRIEAGQTVRTAGVSLTEEMLDAYLGGDVPPRLRELYAAPGYVSYPQSQKLRMVCGLMLECDLTGDVRRLYMEGLAMALIALQAEAIDHRDRLGGVMLPAPLERETIHAIHDHLADNLKAPPSLDSLAKTFGVPAPRLNAGLRREFGATAAELVRGMRLDLAARMLAETDRAIKQIAWDVGYQHLPNFNRAFAARFGQTPAAYRKSVSGWASIECT